MDFFEKYDDKIKEISMIHNITKHYILLGEEISSNFETYLQPVKEFRDAYEHIIRTFTKISGLGSIQDKHISLDEYVQNNLDKALGHEYRAFFDVADWFSIICRKNIYDIVHKYSNKELCDVFPEYPNLKSNIIKISENIAKIREDKDIAPNIINEVNQYQYALVYLYSNYKKLLELNL